ncbi:hypothetical protein [Nocardioides sp. Leaf374]|uniref:VG15 protein n=1 Tax=Nocardioides sp. Leaf374 TaxID=2876560 RepID=UPI001E63A160|nr:hypothetical protein [Nocardioides sp. Leaf374]
MPATPTQQQARSHYSAQSQIAVAAAAAVAELLQVRAPMRRVMDTLAAYQLAGARSAVTAIAAMSGSRRPLIDPRAFAGVSSIGLPASEQIIAVVDAVEPAPVEELPEPWWTSVVDFITDVENVVAGQVRDAARSASQAEIVARPEWQNYVRVLVGPSCPRCVVLAGRVYRDVEEFDRHPPTCDCVMVPVESWEDAHDAGYVFSPQEALDRGMIRGLSKADTDAIRDGADPSKVINARRGMVTAEVLGRRVKATTEGTTKRAQWRRANPTRRVRLRPEAIYRYAESPEDVLRLLRLYGYLTT